MALDPVSTILEIGGKVLDKFFPDPAQRDAAKAELAKMEQSGELAKMANETETLKVYMADTDSARNREVKIATSADAPTLNKVITPVLALGIVGLTFALCGTLIFIADGDLKPSQERIIIFVIGALIPICTQCVSYYFGSSKGDAAQAQHMRDFMQKNGHA